MEGSQDMSLLWRYQSVKIYCQKETSNDMSVTITLPISRTDYLRPVFNCLQALDRPSDTELLIVTDGDKELQKKVDDRIQYLNYKRIRVLNFGDTPASDIDSRRYRISAIHNEIKYHIPEDCDYVFSIEDDTVFPPDALTKLSLAFHYDNQLAFAQGVQLGRRNTPYVGAWKADTIYNPTLIKSLLPSKGIQEIDAGGLYCALIDAELYKMHYFEPFDKKGNVGLSCDLNFGLYLRQMGYKCYIDWSIECDHIGDKGSVNIGNTKSVRVQFTKRGDEWDAETII